jgi:hypothetical protein
MAAGLTRPWQSHTREREQHQGPRTKGHRVPSVNAPANRISSSDIEKHVVDGVSIRVYSHEKTLADCFKYRNKIGLDTVIEALKFYRDRKNVDADALMTFAAVCRVEKIMRPYLEALL